MRTLLLFSLFISLIPTGCQLMAQDRVPDAEDPAYQVLQAAVEAAFPGATVDWDAATVTHPDGTSDRVEMRCYREDDMEGRRMVVFSFGFPDRTRAAVERSISVAEAMAGGRAPRIGVVTLDPDGSPVEARVAFLGPGGQLASCQSLELMAGRAFALMYDGFLAPEAEVIGPVAEVELRALYEHEGGLASMTWGGSFDAGAGRYRLLWPAIVSLESGEMEMFQPESFERGVIRLRALNSGRSWSYTCPEPDACLIPPEEVLAWVSGG